MPPDICLVPLAMFKTCSPHPDFKFILLFHDFLFNLELTKPAGSFISGCCPKQSLLTAKLNEMSDEQIANFHFCCPF